MTAREPSERNTGNDDCISENSCESADDNEQLGDDFVDEVEYKILARPLLDFIIQRVSNFTNKVTPTYRMNVTDFKAFWRDKFDKMRLELAQSQESDLFITDPPLKELEIEILDVFMERPFCPCCLDIRDAQIVLRAEGGITRDIFLKGLEDHLYGEVGKSEHLRLSDRHYGMLIPRHWDFMLTENDVLYKGVYYDAMRIWLYCSDKMVPDARQASATAEL